MAKLEKQLAVTGSTQEAENAAALLSEEQPGGIQSPSLALLHLVHAPGLVPGVRLGDCECNRLISAPG